MRGNHTVTPEITAKVQRAATFVAILSPFYAASRWCRDEAHLFTQHFAGDLAGRIFVVEKEPLDDKPPELTGPRGYRFWYPDQNEQPRTLGKPTPDPDEKAYFDQIEDLARDIQRQLKAMAGRQRDSRPSPSVGAANDGGAPAVFPAKVTDEIPAPQLV